MTILQIWQLNSTNHNINCYEQKQVLGGGAGQHHNALRRISESQLWTGYAEGTYDLVTESGDNYSTFNSKDGRKMGKIDLETGEVRGLLKV